MVRIRPFFHRIFPKSEMLFTNSGRSALQAIIEDFNLKDSGMIILSFICSDVFSPLLISNNISPILVDCRKNSFNLALEDIKKAYSKSKNIKSVLIVHTFGLVNPDIVEIAKFCSKNKLVLIEDCVHCLNVEYKSKLAGTFGDASVFSLSKISKVFIGGVYIRNKGKIKILPERYRINNLDTYRTLNSFFLGRLLIDFIRIFNKKKRLKVNPEKINVLPFPMINLFHISPKKIDLKRRREIAGKICKKINIKIEKEGNFFHSIPLLVGGRDKTIVKLRQNKINCEKLWTNPLSLDSSLRKKFKLNKTENAEDFSRKIINIIINPCLSDKTIEEDSTKIFKLLQESK